MARLPRLSLPGWPHLVLLQGHSGQAVFLDDSDRSAWITLLRECAPSCGVLIHAYSLLDSEIRLLVTPQENEGLSRMMQAMGRRYGASFNRRHGRSGTLWNGRFRTAVIDPELHLISAMRFVEEVEGGSIPGSFSPWPWSSASHHLGLKADPLVSDHAKYWNLGNTPFDREVAYRQLLEQGLPSGERSRIFEAVTKGWPLGSAEFLLALSATTSRRLSPRQRGRPPKKTE